MTIKEKLESIRNICRGRESCETDCTYYENCCFPTGYPVDWSDEFIEQLASELERPKVKRLKPSEMYEVWQYPWCRTLYRYDEPGWKFCPICGAELEEMMK